MSPPQRSRGRVEGGSRRGRQDSQQQTPQQQPPPQGQPHPSQYAPIGSEIQTPYGSRPLAPHPPGHNLAPGQILPPPPGGFLPVANSLSVPGQGQLQNQQPIYFHNPAYGQADPHAPVYQQQSPLSRKRSRTDIGDDSDRPAMPVLQQQMQYQQHYPPPPEHYYQQPPPQQQQQYYTSQQPQQYNVPMTTYAGQQSADQARRNPHESMVGKPGFPAPRHNRGERSRFLQEDDDCLRMLKERNDVKLTWEQITDFFPGRKSGTLQVRYCTKLKEKGPVKWTEELDKKLLKHNAEYEAERWKVLAVKMGSGMTPTAVEERYRELEEQQQFEVREGPAGPEARE